MVGVDIREGEVLAAAVDAGGRITARASLAARGADVEAAVLSVVERVTPASDGPSSLGIAAAGTETAAAARAIASIASKYSALFPHPVTIGRGTAASVAESWVGAARGLGDVVYFAIGNHATAGVVRAGHAMTGAHGREPEAGWLALNPVEREDYRKVGCVEAEVAAAGIVRRLIWRIKAGDRSRVQDTVGGDLSAITAALVFDAARAKDGVSISVIRDTAKYLGMAAANLVVMVDPQMLVLGGLMAAANDLLFDPIMQELARRLPGPMMETLKVSAAELGDDAPAIGAARHASLVIPA